MKLFGADKLCIFFPHLGSHLKNNSYDLKRESLYIYSQSSQVILIQVPLEIVWTATVSWHAGDVVCRVMVFFRILGFYASSFMMIVISLDRLSAIMCPISHMSSTKRTKIMLILAWTMAPVCSLPQVGSLFFGLKY